MTIKLLNLESKNGKSYTKKTEIYKVVIDKSSQAKAKFKRTIAHTYFCASWRRELDLRRHLVASPQVIWNQNSSMQ